MPPASAAGLTRGLKLSSPSVLAAPRVDAAVPREDLSGGVRGSWDNVGMRNESPADEPDDNTEEGLQGAPPMKPSDATRSVPPVEIDRRALTGMKGVADAIARMQPQIDTTALTGMKGVADAIARMQPQIDTTALTGMKGVADAIARMQSPLVGVVLPSYVAATKALFDELGIDDEMVPGDLSFSFSADDRAYSALLESAPDVAEAVDRAARAARTPFWTRSAVRNALSWTLVFLVLGLFVGGTFIPQWGTLLINTLSGGFAALEVRRRTTAAQEE